MQLNTLEAKNRLSELIRLAQSGDEVVIANRGVPVARLLPVETPGAGLGHAQDILDWLDRHPLPPHARRSADDIDKGLGTEPLGWD